MYTQRQIISFISENRDFLKTEFHISKIGIFGSYARKEQNQDSDIDLIIEFEKGTENLFDLKLALKAFFRNKFNLNIYICREKYIKPRFKKRILNDTIYVD